MFIVTEYAALKEYAIKNIRDLFQLLPVHQTTEFEFLKFYLYMYKHP